MDTLILGSGFVESHLDSKIPRFTGRIPTDPKWVEDFLREKKPSVVINLIAFTGRPNIDACEKDPARTVESNLTVPTVLASVCAKLGIHFVHVGSGCIFYGKSPSPGGWKETDFANPLSLYSRTKYAADLAIGAFDTSCILRIRMPISRRFVPRNYLTKITNYPLVVDSLNSMTFMDDFIKAIDWVIENKKQGIYHLTNPEPISATAILDKYKKFVPTHSFTSINEDELNRLTVAPRSNCIIDNSKIMHEGFNIEPASSQIDSYLRSFCSASLFTG